MTADSLDLAKAEFLHGQAAFERGNYRQAVSHFEQAVDLATATTVLGGEIQIWLVNAYSAVDRQADATALCETLTHHPDLEIRKQAKNLLYILQAPALKRPGNWMSKIPDLGEIANEGTPTPGQPRPAGVSQPTAKSTPKADPIPSDPGQINRQDNDFLWIALASVALLLGGLLWLS
jgi:tetratricopeptide (TPR) repeat protein